MDDVLYNTAEAARYCGVSEATIRKHSAPSYRGRYPLHPVEELRQLTGEVRFTKEELDRWRSLDRKPGRPREEKPSTPSPDSPQGLIEAYRSELARLYGQDVADASIVEYGYGGWFRVGVAGRRPDGHIIPPTTITPMRKPAFLERLENLRNRTPGETS